MTSKLSILALAAVLLATPVRSDDRPVAAPPKPPSAAIEYNRDVRPILAENCFACHGPDSAARKADLRLDRREDAVASKAIVPGDPKKSELVTRILTDDPRELMPPPKSHKKLTVAQKEILQKWIAAGAEYQQHWSFIAPTRPAVPVVKNKAWVRNPIDSFVLAELEKRNLSPAPEADRRTLARRLSLDLTGLPPSPADVDAFVNDASKDYYEKYVDKLMKSPHWGEHRARYWLDAARYADTHGIHFDNFREVWAYRDYVIKSFNDNMPFDRFTTEQLAGDLLPNRTIDQQIATGFIRCNITTSEGGAINEEYLVLYARDRTETMSQVYLGLTTGCAVCHDHKFDPVSQKDFYALTAFFNNHTQNAMDGNVHNTPPIIQVPRMEDRPRFDAVQKELAAAKAKVDGRKAAAKGEFDKWLKTASAEELTGKIPTAGLAFHAPLKEGKGDAVAFNVNGKGQLAKLPAGYDFTGTRADKTKGAFSLKTPGGLALKDVGDFDKNQPFAVSMYMAITKRGNGGAIVARMDEANGFRGWDVWMQNDRVAMHVVNLYPVDALKVVAKTPLQPNKWTHVTVAYDGSAKPGGIKIYYDGEPQATDTETDTLKSTTRTTVPLKIGARSATAGLTNVNLEDLRIYDRPFTAIDAQQVSGSRRTADILTKAADKRTPAELDELSTWWLVSKDATYRELSAAYRKIQEEEVAIRGRGTIAHVMQEKTSAPEAYVLFRGDYDKRRDKVGADVPKALPPLGKDAPRNRLGLAQWVLAKDNPLTARVTVNRFWQELFGNGLVRTSGDFGITGEQPSHPELLDWMAIEFRTPSWGACCEDVPNWDVKQFFRLLVTSATYRQAAVATKEKLEKDRDNKFLSRGPRFRMDGEMVRDYALAASGLLVPKVGGASVKPYQPDGVWEAVAMIGSNTRDYRADKGENLYRRSMYTFWKRAAPPASMELMNAPNRETCTVRRERTNTPMQALLTLNDVQFVEAARVLAEKTLASSEKVEARLDFVAKKLLARPFTQDEMAIVGETLSKLRAHYKDKPDDAKKLIAYGDSKPDAKLDAGELAAWTMLVNQLLNLDEVLNK